MSDKIKVKGNKIKLVAGCGYTKPGETLLKIKDTGNGLICVFPAWNKVIEQDYYVSLNYAQAAYLKKALQHVENLGGDNDE